MNDKILDYCKIRAFTPGGWLPSFENFIPPPTIKDLKNTYPIPLGGGIIFQYADSEGVYFFQVSR